MSRMERRSSVACEISGSSEHSNLVKVMGFMWQPFGFFMHCAHESDSAQVVESSRGTFVGAKEAGS